MIQPKIGFLFDVDGTLTTYRKNDSIIDILILNDLEKIRTKKFPIGLVTGRSINWVRNLFFNYIEEELKEYIFISAEFGLVTFYQQNKQKARISKETNNALKNVKKESIEAICEYRELEFYESYTAPDFRCLWIEPKEIMITFRSLPLFGLTTDKYIKIVEPIIEKYSEILRIIPNKYALDILPLNAGKRLAAKKAIKILDPDKKIQKWFAFGDSEADEEMALAKKNLINFYKVEQGKTNITHYLIEKALAGMIQLH